MAEPVLKQTLTMHMNGGSDYSELHYAITADGKQTGITRHVRTNGRPEYFKTDDFLKHGEDTFDVLATGGVGWKEWVLSRLTRLAEVSEAG